MAGSSINYNPFFDKKTGLVSDMIGTIAGAAITQMGLLDYIFVIPFLAKLFICKTNKIIYTTNKTGIKYLNVFLNIASWIILMPFSVAKTAIYAGLGLTGLVTLGWLIKRHIFRRRISSFTQSLNQLTAKPVPVVAGENRKKIPARSLGEIYKLRDGDMRTHKIRVMPYTIELVNGSGVRVAIIEKTVENIKILEELFPSNEPISPLLIDNFPHAMWFNKAIHHHFIDIAAVTHEMRVGMATSYMADVYSVMLHRPGNYIPYIAPNNNVTPDTVPVASLTSVPLDVRKLLACHSVFAQTKAVDGPIAQFSQEVRDEAYGRFMSVKLS